MTRYEPMLATSWPAAFDDPDWFFDVKWDGVRAILRGGPEPTVTSRRGNTVSGSYPELSGVPWPDVVVDGEIVVLDDRGAPSFQMLQQRMNTTRPDRGLLDRVPVAFMVFDVLEVDAVPIIGRPLEERRTMLEQLTLPNPAVVSPLTQGAGRALFDAAVERRLEGIVAKRSASTYRPGVRSPDWRKVVHFPRIRAVVGGFTPGEGSRAGTFGALQLGLHTGDGLRWIGGVGSGFDDASLTAIRAALDELSVDASPFTEDRPHPAMQFVEPSLVAVVAIRQWTEDGHLRHPVFHGLVVEDPASITWDREGPQPRDSNGGADIP